MFNFEARVLIGWLVRIFTSQPIKMREYMLPNILVSIAAHG